MTREAEGVEHSQYSGEGSLCWLGITNVQRFNFFLNPVFKVTLTKPYNINILTVSKMTNSIAIVIIVICCTECTLKVYIS